MKRLQRYFFAGLVIIVPVVATCWLIGVAFDLITGWSSTITDYYNIEFVWYHRIILRILVLLSMFLIIALVGLFTTRALGSKITNVFQKLLHKIPFFNRIYSIAKQIANALAMINSSTTNFSRVVLVQYPRKGLYTIGFVTNQTCQVLTAQINKLDPSPKFLNLFIPTTPNPTSGVFVIVPAEDVVELDISVEDAVKIVISGGTVSLDDAVKGDLNE